MRATTQIPMRAFEAHSAEELKIARETGNRLLETYHTGNLSRLAARHGDPRRRSTIITTSIRNYFDAGKFSLLPQPTGGAGTLSRPPRTPRARSDDQSASPTTPFARSYFPEIDITITHLREVLGDTTYEALAHAGATMTNAAMANYALEQIDRARAQLSPTDDSR